MDMGVSGMSAAWMWIVVGMALCAIEVVAPGAFMIWIGAAAIMVGLISFVATMSGSVSLVLFAVLAAGLALFGRRVYGATERRGGVTLNDRAGGLVGRVGLLETAIGADPGRVRFDDAQWRARGPELPAGTRIKVTGVMADGSTLLVEPA